MAQSIVVYIAGMHRSGTSALTMLLHRLGCEIPGEIETSTSHNSYGHWEPREFIRLNHQILQHWDSDWCELRLPELQDTSVQSMPFSAELVTYVREFCGTAHRSVLKDPRVCYTLPFWLEATHQANKSAVVILPYRHPVEVALSLAARNDMPMDVALALWLCNALSAEYYSRGYSRCAVCYENLLLDWRTTCIPVVELIGISIPDQTDPRHAELDQSIDQSQRHHAVTDEIPSYAASSIYKLAIETYNLFSQPLNSMTTLVAFDDLRRRVAALINEQELVQQAHVFTRVHHSRRAIVRLQKMITDDGAVPHGLVFIEKSEIKWLRDVNAALTAEVMWLRDVNAALAADNERLRANNERLRPMRLLRSGVTKITVFWRQLWQSTNK